MAGRLPVPSQGNGRADWGRGGKGAASPTPSTDQAAHQLETDWMWSYLTIRSDNHDKWSLFCFVFQDCIHFPNYLTRHRSNFSKGLWLENDLAEDAVTPIKVRLFADYAIKEGS